MKKNHHSRDRRFGRSVLPQLTVWPLLLLSLMGWLTAADKDSAKETAEMFHVSYVGRGGAAETRELLGAVYTEVAAEYNERIEQEAAETNQGQRYKGERVRILRKIKEKHAEGNLYLCAYAGTPSVFVVPGEPLKSGDLSPPLAGIAASGEHTTEIVRTVADPNASKGKEPSLQKVDKSGGGVTFFGIPLDTGGSSSSDESSSSSSGTKKIREKRTLPLYKATVSTEATEEGPPPMSQQLFLGMLKNGEIFSVAQLELRRCQECRGFGRIPDKIRPPGQREADGKIACPECDAVGKIYWNVTYKVGW